MLRDKGPYRSFF